MKKSDPRRKQSKNAPMIEDFQGLIPGDTVLVQSKFGLIRISVDESAICVTAAEVGTELRKVSGDNIYMLIELVETDYEMD